MLLEINKTGQKNQNQLCLARKVVILKNLKNFTGPVSGSPELFAVDGKFVSLVHCRRQIREKKVDKEK